MAKAKQTTPTHDFVIPQGEDFIFQLKLYTGDNTDKHPLDITGYQFRCEVREKADDDSPSMIADCRIMDSENGIVEIHFKADESDGLELGGGYYGALSPYTCSIQQVEVDGRYKRIRFG